MLRCLIDVINWEPNNFMINAEFLYYFLQYLLTINRVVPFNNKQLKYGVHT